ncbi:hypothetical protein PYW08_009014 [Mythimna loreyi]|uniref:Uncharacterized protein n=1 Tax=Mythimna loreyi TaxID=667449 RepID=A0ACC2QBB4_9NEOP|nr:hypothetical protein PYW08_009014 [Mythimna loreyi]
MTSKISYFILFEILIFATGKPSYRQDINHDELQYGLKKLIEDIIKQGYDVMVNHHEDHPGTHHEDITQITYNGGKSKFHHKNEKQRTVESYRGANGKNLQYNDHPSVTNFQNYNLNLKKRPKPVENNIDTEEMKYRSQARGESENINDVLEFLNDLDKTLNIKGSNDLEMRCSGNRCGGTRGERGNNDEEQPFMPDSEYNNNVYGKQLRCNGKSCNIDRDNDRNDRENLRCYGNRCSRKSNYRYNNGDQDNDNIDLKHILRSNGDKYGLNRDDDDDDDYNNNDANYDNNYRVDTNSLRCVGDRCGLNRYDDDDDDRVETDSLRCVGDRCGLNRYDNDDDRVGTDSLRCVGDRCGLNRYDNDDDRIGRDSMRCVGDRCGLNRYDNDDDRVGTESLRCVGDRCGLNRYDDDDDRIGRDSMRCVGDRCGLNRYNDDDDDDRVGIDSLRCVGNRCGINRNDDDEDREDTNSFRCHGDRCDGNRYGNERENLRCSGKKCSRTRTDDKNRAKYDLDLSRIFYSILPKANSLRGNDLSLNEKRRFFDMIQQFFDIFKEKVDNAIHGNSTIEQVND